ncbi:hypothetical protein GCM10027419_27380 [Pandoraea terrae]
MRQMPVHWLPVGRNARDIAFSSQVEGVLWELRLNNFPDEPLYTLFIDAKEILHFTIWPDAWGRPGGYARRFA